MGDRGAIQFIHDGGTVVMYTHWQGHKVEQLLRGAMCMVEAGGRLTDPVYAIRIIMQHCWEGEGRFTGWGVTHGVQLLDIEYPVVVVDWDKNLVYEKDVFTGKCTPLNTIEDFGAKGRDQLVNS